MDSVLWKNKFFRAIQLVVSPVNPRDTSESVRPKNFVHEALDTPSLNLDCP